MQLIIILLVTVSILTFLSGATIFLGAKKGDRIKSFWFFIATIFATIWTISICLFLTASPGSEDAMVWHADWTYISAIFIDIALLAYISWKEKYGKSLIAIFLIFGCILTTIFVKNPSYLYTEVILSHTGNGLVTNVGPFYFIYIGFFCLLIPAVILTLLKQIISSNSPKKRGGDLVLLIGFAISGTMSLIFDLILPFWRWDLVWIGPLAISTTIIAFYYSILRYRILNLSSSWLKILSYIVIIASMAVVYMVIFSIIFAAMFKGATPSTEVIILNFVMILIVLLLMPATNELNIFVRSLISNQRIDVVYIIKKITKLSPKQIDLNELAEFLAESLHLGYVGFIIDNQIHSSKQLNVSAENIKTISKPNKSEHGIWQNLDEDSPIVEELNLSAIASLRDDDGKVYGQLILGKPSGKTGLSKRDIAQIEIIINLVSIIVNSKYYKRRD